MREISKIVIYLFRFPRLKPDKFLFRILASRDFNRRGRSLPKWTFIGMLSEHMCLCGLKNCDNFSAMIKAKIRL